MRVCRRPRNARLVGSVNSLQLASQVPLGKGLSISVHMNSFMGHGGVTRQTCVRIRKESKMKGGLSCCAKEHLHKYISMCVCMSVYTRIYIYILLYRHRHAHIYTRSHRYIYILYIYMYIYKIYMYTNIIYSFIHFFLYVAIHSGEKRPGWWKPAARQMLECELAEGQREFLNRRYT